VRQCVGGDNKPAIGGSEKVELMKRAILIVSAAAAIALAPGDPCASIIDPTAHQACIDEFLRNMHRNHHIGGCDASPFSGQLGQVCG
jgi:hypothetical protein